MDSIQNQAPSKKLPHKQLEEIVAELRNPESRKDKYSLLLEVGRAGALEYTPLVESFLTYRSDPMLVRLAVQILCKQWPGASRYKETVRSLLDRSDWDSDEEVREAAISAAGELLRSEMDMTMLGKLLSILDDESERELIRKFAYIALARASGQNWDDLPSVRELPAADELSFSTIILNLRHQMGET